jgi:hypothetical protein
MIIILAFVLSWGIGAGIYFVPKTEPIPPMWGWIIGLFLGLLPFVIMIYFIYELNQGRLSKNKIYQTLLNAPEKIVWIYPGVLNKNGVAINHSIHFFDNAGNTFELTELKNQSEQAIYIKKIASFCHTALIGFRIEWMKIYHQNPLDFRKNAIQYEQALKK